MMLDNYMRKMRTVGVLVMLALLSACATNIVVDGNVPSPLIKRLPITASVTYSEELKNFTYTENERARSANLKSLNLSDAQIVMFDQVFDRLFNMVSSDSANSDLNITPQILEFQYSAPAETQLKLYEVWLKYRIQVTDSQNENLADWVVKGYGKTPAGGSFSSAGKALNAATNVALRDVGAQLSIGFEKQPSIQGLLAGANKAPARSVLSGQSSDDSEPSTGGSQ